MLTLPMKDLHDQILELPIIAGTSWAHNAAEEMREAAASLALTYRPPPSPLANVLYDLIAAAQSHWEARAMEFYRDAFE